MVEEWWKQDTTAPPVPGVPRAPGLSAASTPAPAQSFSDTSPNLSKPTPGEPEDCEPGYTKKYTQDGWDCVLTGTPAPPAVPQSCPQGHEWDEEHKGCKVAGTNWDDGCFIHTDGKTYCKGNPLPSTGTGSTGTETSGVAGGGTQKYTPTKSPYDSATSKAIYEMLMGIMNGTDLPFGPETIAKMQASALQSNKAQLGNSRDEVQKRLINSGLSRSGIAPATYGRLESAAAADFSNNLRQIATTAVQQNYNARMSALQEAQKFLQSERANSLSQDQMLLSYARLNQEWQSMQAGFSQQWKIVQNGDEQALMKLMLCIRVPSTCGQ